MVAHPPCERWHQLSAVNNKRWGYRINEDGGCFAAALGAVRKFGGVLEHPAESRAFRLHGIPEPAHGGWQMTLDGDWVTEVWQSVYGHRARKRTWLLYRGVSAPPALRWERRPGEFQIGRFDATRPQLPAIERAATPIEFRDLLIAIAKTAHPAGRPLLQQRLGISADLEGGAHHVPEDGDVRHQCRDARGGQTVSPELIQAT